MRIGTTALLFIACCTGLSFGQVPQGLSKPAGSNRVTLTVRTRLADDRPLNLPAQVQVISGLGAPIAHTFTRDDGRVEFRDIPSGIYRIRVSGSGIETVTSDPFDIGDNDRTHYESVTVRLSRNNTISGAMTVSSQELALPPKAKEEMGKGIDAFAKGDVSGATAHIQKAIEIFPGYDAAHYSLGVILVSQGDKAAAEKEFEKSVEVNGQFVPGYISMARLKFATNESEGLKLLRKALTIDPNNVEGLVLLARVQFNRGDFESALATAKRTHALPHDHFADIHLIAAEIYQKQNRNAEAVAESELYLKEYPGSPRAQQVRAAVEQIKSRN